LKTYLPDFDGITRLRHAPASVADVVQAVMYLEEASFVTG